MPLSRMVDLSLGILGAALKLEGDAPEVRRLAEKAARLRSQWGEPKEALSNLKEAALPAEQPLLELAHHLALTEMELLGFLLVLSVEIDPEAGRLVAWLQAPVGGSRPTLGLVQRLSAGISPRFHLAELLGGHAVSSGLLNLEGTGPLPERTLSVPHHLLLAASGVPASAAGAYPEGPSTIPLPPSIQEELEKQALALASGTNRVLVVRAADEEEGKAVANALARILGRTPLFLENPQVVGLVPWLILAQHLPVFLKRMGPSERFVLPPLSGWQEPVVVVSGLDGGVEGRGRVALSWKLGVPPAAERAGLWESHLGPTELAGALGRDHRHGPGRIANLARLAIHRASVAGRPTVEAMDVVGAALEGDNGGLGSLATPLPVRVLDDGMVLNEGLRRDLEVLLLRCRQREGLARDLGVAASNRYGPGVRALFVGPSGTGKTLGASWLAARLALPLYRVDLASVVSKYIGETEKNLSELLARAEAAEVVLFFDEADSLFGKRTDVQHSNDRYANAQTNYLLQRIEHYEGIVLLASNSRSRFDPAFSRRLDFVIEFPAPGPTERRALWEAHLGSTHSLTPKDINRLAAHSDLSGGNIRNVVLTAAVLAAEGGRPVAWNDVLRALTLECRKQGIPLPSGLGT